MAKRHLVDLVKKLKDSGINISFTKPRSKFLRNFVPPKRSNTVTKVIS